MSFTKITTTELDSRGATTLPNQPAMSATALKQEFDAPAKNIIAPKFNNLVDELEATTAAASLGAVAPTGRVGNNVQGIMNSISNDLDTLKGIVDGATAAIAAKSTVAWNQNITTGQRIATVTIDGTPTDVYAPTGGGGGGGAGDMTKATYDPNDHGYVDKAAGVTDGTNVLSYSTLNGKANAATSLAGYGITDAYTKTEVNDGFMAKPASGITAGEVIRADGSSGFNWETVDSAPTSASTKLVTSGGVYTALTGKASKSVLDAHLSRTPRDISSEIGTNGATLLAAIAEQNLEKYGFKIGDYFMSPANRSLVTQTYSSGSVTTQTVNVKFKYYLADMDAWYGGYDSYEVVGTHHVELFVDCMINRQWHSAADITSVGYNISALYNYLKGDIFTAIKADMKALFGGSTGVEHLIQHQLYLTKAFEACEWTTTYIHTPSEFEVYGGNAFSGNDAQKYAFNKKLALFDKFRFNQILGSGNSMWLYNMYSTSNACYAANAGRAINYSPVGTYRAAGLILLH